MSVTKIDDTELFNQNRFHVNQPDVPGKTAQEMKEFMDYVPRQVLIPKINELTDAVNASAPSESVYKKEETYNKSEADGTFAKASDVYSKTETDSKLTQKADALDVYTKEQTYSKDEADAIKSGLLESSSDRVIADVAAQPTSDSTLICRENGVLKILQNVEIEPIYDGAALEDYGTPAPCVRYRGGADCGNRGARAYRYIGIGDKNVFICSSCTTQSRPCWDKWKYAIPFAPDIICTLSGAIPADYAVV